MSKETDKELSDLYLARSEGKIIEARDAVGKWHQAGGGAIHHEDRIRPQTLEEAVEEAFKDFERVKMPQECRDKMFFRLGAEWRDENPKDQE